MLLVCVLRAFCYQRRPIYDCLSVHALRKTAWAINPSINQLLVYYTVVKPQLFEQTYRAQQSLGKHWSRGQKVTVKGYQMLYWPGSCRWECSGFLVCIYFCHKRLFTWNCDDKLACMERRRCRYSMFNCMATDTTATMNGGKHAKPRLKRTIV